SVCLSYLQHNNQTRHLEMFQSCPRRYRKEELILINVGEFALK
ncbi:hypothetical protein CP8484711_1142B, partial [Chlamydia psittaci 84-8471/1]